MLTQTDAQYAAAWDEYRRRWRTIYWMWAGAIAGNLLSLAWPHASGVLSIAALPVLVGIFWGYSKVLYWPCPRCGQPFLTNRAETADRIGGGGEFWLLAPLSWRCRHCRLPKWAVRDPD